MEKSYFKLTVSGRNTNTAFLKEKLIKITTYLKLPMNIKEVQSSKAETMVSYLDEVINISPSMLESELKKLTDFLLKVNPKTGKICKCSDCNNCPSKRLLKLQKHPSVMLNPGIAN